MFIKRIQDGSWTVTIDEHSPKAATLGFYPTANYPDVKKSARYLEVLVTVEDNDEVRVGLEVPDGSESMRIGNFFAVGAASRMYQFFHANQVGTVAERLEKFFYQWIDPTSRHSIPDPAPDFLNLGKRTVKK